MTANHPGTGVSHHFSDLIPHVRFVAMDGTFGTCRFISMEGTFLKPFLYVFQQFFALGTQTTAPAVFPPAENYDHCRCCPSFSVHYRTIYKHCRITLTFFNSYPLSLSPLSASLIFFARRPAGLTHSRRYSHPGQDIGLKNKPCSNNCEQD